ncbi:MAG: polysaccharide deacetylase family protein [Armatimonadetes bacterium]|nr:polysaccharide deacetylase family protein [Armatimonadota bacterium]
MTDYAPVPVTLPDGVRCAIALSYDTDMAGGYAPDGVCHGRTAPFLAEYMLRLCDTAEQFGVALQFFQIINGLEGDQDVGYLREIIARGHVVDSHTYSHAPLVGDPEALDDELSRANRLLNERLGVTSTVLRGPGGYAEGLRGLPENQRIILDQGFEYVSCRYSDNLRSGDWDAAVSNPSVDVPCRYDSGLIELPIQTWTDRSFFDTLRCVDRAALESFRAEWGHRRVPGGFRPAWTAPGALDEWIDYNLQVAQHVYDNRLLCVMAWHPYSHYLHDPDNRMLPALLEWAAAQPERVWVCTLRDACGMVG